MRKRPGVSIRLLGPFSVETADSRVLSIRSRKARALIAYLAMKPDYWASREELATLLWGDSLDVMARQSLRQCLTSLRQDLRLVPNLLPIEGERVLLAAETLLVDAREIMTLARLAEPEAVCRAAELCRGEFLADLKLEAEEFESWRRHEAERLRATAAHVLSMRVRLDDECGAGESAVDAAERLVELEPTREEWQRMALTMWARHRGREAALGRAKVFSDLLRRELGVAPDKESSALIRAIEAGEIGPAVVAPPTAIGPAADDMSTAPANLTEPPPAPAPTFMQESRPSRARRWPRALAASVIILLGLSAIGAWTLWQRNGAHSVASGSDHNGEGIKRRAETVLYRIAVLPFTVDKDDTAGKAFADALKHDLTAYLVHYAQMRVVSDESSDRLRDGPSDLSRVRTELGAPYAVVGRIQGGDAAAFQVTFHLVDTTSYLDVWSQQVRQEGSDAAVAADDVARGVARALTMQVVYAEARRSRGATGPEDSIEGLVTRARAAEQLGPWTANLTEAQHLFEQAIQRNPHYQPAMIGVARVYVMANGNMIELDPPVDLERARRLLQEVLVKQPENYSAHYILGQVLSEQGSYEAAIESFERSLQINPAAIFANAHIGHLLTQLGRPREGLERIQRYLRLGGSDPSLGYAYLYAAEAELALGEPRSALDWTLRANAFFPGAPRFEAWLAALYEITGDDSNAVRHAGAFRQAEPVVAAHILRQEKAPSSEGQAPPAILQALRVALAAAHD